MGEGNEEDAAEREQGSDLRLPIMGLCGAGLLICLALGIVTYPTSTSNYGSFLAWIHI